MAKLSFLLKESARYANADLDSALGESGKGLELNLGEKCFRLDPIIPEADPPEVPSWKRNKICPSFRPALTSPAQTLNTFHSLDGY